MSRTIKNPAGERGRIATSGKTVQPKSNRSSGFVLIGERI
jgi:hypothetical protein